MGIASYLARNGLYPTRVVFRVDEMLDHLAFADKDKLFLVIVHSFTRFSMAELQLLFSDLRSAAEQGASVAIMSDIIIRSPEFVKSNIQFVEYAGDLFFGRYTWYRNNKAVRNTINEDKVEADILNGRVTAERAKNTKYRQEFWDQFGEFTTPREPIMGELPERVYQPDGSDARYRDKLIDVDLFATDR